MDRMDGPTIVFACRKCGKHIRRPAHKIGTLVECGKCKKVNRTPGLAGHLGITSAEFAMIKKELSLHGWVLAFGGIGAALVFAAAFLFPAFNRSEIWFSLPILCVFLYILLGFSLSLIHISRYMGRDMNEIRTLCKYCFPVAIFLSITSYFSLRGGNWPAPRRRKPCSGTARPRIGVKRKIPTSAPSRPEARGTTTLHRPTGTIRIVPYRNEGRGRDIKH
jgi:uncharacterized membrane protein SirB2